MRSVFVVVALATFTGLGCRTVSSVEEPDVARLPDIGRPLEPVDSVAFTFAWPAGLRASVRATRDSFSSSGTRTDSSHHESTFVLEVREHPEGLALSYSDVAPDMNATGDVLQDFADMLTLLLPERIVSGEGVLVRLVGIEEISGWWRENLMETLDRAPGVPPPGAGADSLLKAMDAMLTNLSSEEFLTAMASEEWNMQVGFWLGGVFAVGVWYSLDMEVPNPVLGDIPVLNRMEFAVEERLPCMAGGTAPDCVRIYVEVTPDLEDFVDRMMEYRARMGVATDADREALREQLLSIEVVRTYTLVTDPRTLVPRSFTKTQEVYGTGGAEEAWKWHEKHIEYTWY